MLEFLLKSDLCTLKGLLRAIFTRRDRGERHRGYYLMDSVDVDGTG